MGFNLFNSRWHTHKGEQDARRQNEKGLEERVSEGGY